MSVLGKLSLANLAYQQFPFLAKRTQRQIGELIPHVVVSEDHRDELQITDHPVQVGSPITDHAYKMPAEVTIECGWSESPVSGNIVGAATNIAKSFANLGSALTGANQNQTRAMYLMLQALQSSATLLEVTTGKRVYRNMLIKSLTTTTSAETENILLVKVTLREVFLVGSTSAVISTNADNHADPSNTAPPVKMGLQSLKATTGFSA